jgi:hypothetical protein
MTREEAFVRRNYSSFNRNYCVYMKGEDYVSANFNYNTSGLFRN